MGKKTARANNTFLLGSIILIVLVLIVVVLFLFYAFKIQDKKDSAYNERYEIALEQSVIGSPLTVYMNDSLLFQGTPQSRFTLVVARFASESSLLVVDNETDRLTTVELPVKSAKISIGKDTVSYFAAGMDEVRIAR